MDIVGSAWQFVLARKIEFVISTVLLALRLVPDANWQRLEADWPRIANTARALRAGFSDWYKVARSLMAIWTGKPWDGPTDGSSSRETVAPKPRHDGAPIRFAFLALLAVGFVGCTPSARRVAHVAVVASGGVVAELQRASLSTYERATNELIASGLRGEDYALAVAPMDAELNARTEALALASDALFAVARALDANDSNVAALASDAATAIEHAVDVLRDEHALPAVSIPASARREVIRLRALSTGEDAGHADE